MKTIQSLSFAAGLLLSTLTGSIAPAQASFGDFMLGVGATVGIGALVKSSQNAQRCNPTSPEQNFFRGVEDGQNGARYDNPCASPDYDRGFQEGARRRQRGQ
jgi:hypothetical protein